MRYSGTRKQETRTRVVRCAAAAVRARGPEGVGVAEIMAEAGLTHGGFYAHFPSKEALIAAAVEEAFAQSRRTVDRLTEGLGRSQALCAFIDAYASTEHRRNPQVGCPISTLSNAMPRQGPTVRRAFDAGVAASIARLADWLPQADPAVRRNLASSMLAELTGAMALARAVADEELADRLIGASKSRIKAQAGLAESLQSSAKVTLALSNGA
jgi:TetR/AcrR family transcriptional repressor of nem operon